MHHQDLIKPIIFIYTILVFLVSLLTNLSIDQNIFRWMTGITSIVVFIWILFEKWIWKWYIFRSLSIQLGTPVLHGTWKGVLKYDKDAFKKSGKVDLYVSIHQTLTTIYIKSYFKKPSESCSIVAKIDKVEPNQFRLSYLYKNEAPYGKRTKNRPHDGACVLNIIGNPARELSGGYFTERGGTGTIKLNKYNPKVSETLDEALKLKY